VIIIFVGKLAPMRGVCLDHPAPVSENAEAGTDGHDAPRHAASAAYEGPPVTQRLAALIASYAGYGVTLERSPHGRLSRYRCAVKALRSALVHR